MITSTDQCTPTGIPAIRPSLIVWRIPCTALPGLRTRPARTAGSWRLAVAVVVRTTWWRRR
ncbi:hypothetical protein Athai_15230 [Actinocatenispora thailandica]|uniref:Uncharacterized protein n=1 Tax=Actinocatenispora thailandica TaxID=227318 RepID=A0A7R7DLS0_9ACTN|nr:hypothetical protein Athai_15230 [Actinocatenispora thailandica]